MVRGALGDARVVPDVLKRGVVNSLISEANLGSADDRLFALFEISIANFWYSPSPLLNKTGQPACFLYL